VLNAVCHCDNCRKRTGSAFGWSVYFKDAQVVAKSGAFGVYNQTTIPQKRYFCSTCATTLYWTVEMWPGLVGVAGGCFVGQDLPDPAFTLMGDKKCAWVNLPEPWATSLQVESYRQR
jgi:hypothetical protein